MMTKCMKGMNGQVSLHAVQVEHICQNRLSPTCGLWVAKGRSETLPWLIAISVADFLLSFRGHTLYTQYD